MIIPARVGLGGPIGITCVYVNGFAKTMQVLRDEGC